MQLNVFFKCEIYGETLIPANENTAIYIICETHNTRLCFILHYFSWMTIFHNSGNAHDLNNESNQQTVLDDLGPPRPTFDVGFCDQASK